MVWSTADRFQFRLFENTDTFEKNRTGLMMTYSHNGPRYIKRFDSSPDLPLLDIALATDTANGRNQLSIISGDNILLNDFGARGRATRFTNKPYLVRGGLDSDFYASPLNQDSITANVVPIPFRNSWIPALPGNDTAGIIWFVTPENEFGRIA